MQEVHSFTRGWAAIALALLGAVVSGPGELRAQDPLPAPPGAEQLAPGGPVVIENVEVRGNRRFSESAVRGTAGLQPGARVTALDVQNAIRRLMATGNFETVEIFSRGAPETGFTLILEVEERPFIAQIEFRGLQRVSARTVRDTVGLRENQPLDPNQIVRTEQMIRDLLARQGIQLVSVDTALTPLTQPEGSYRLTFQVREGDRLSIADVEFIGNVAFSDGALRDVMRTRPEGFFWWRTGRFDRELFQSDLRERLPDFYGARGYIDFAVVSDTMVIDPETGKARLVVEVAEGPQYRLGEFDIDGNTRFPTDQLTRIFAAQRRSVLGLPFMGGGTRERGEVFDRVGLDDATRRVQQMYRNEGYLYAQVEPVIERVAPEPSSGEAPQVNVTWNIVERSPFYINKINIAGNTRTHESVIRDRIFVFPGDVYNEERLIQSYQSLSGLGFFETPLPTPDIDPDPENGTVDLVFHVNEKQTGSISFGTAIGGGYRGGGLSGFLGFTEPNLFGQAKQGELRAEYGYGRNSFQGSYTDPALFGTRNSGSISLFHMGDRFVQFEDGRRTVTGGTLRYGFPVSQVDRWTRGFAGYTLSRTRYQALEEDCTDPLSIFCLPSATASTFNLGITRDTRDHPLFPTVGTRQGFSLGQTGGILGGDGDFQKATTDYEWWVPVGSLGGQQPGSRPIRMAIGLQARTGMIFGDAGRFPFERFFVGGTQFGQQLRGYEERTVTPFGYFDLRSGLPSSQRLGDAFLVLTGEYAVRLMDNVSVSAFADAGNVWSNVSHIDPTRLLRGAGVGVTIVTPFGPLGLDYAYGFDRDEPGWKFHFKLGQGF
ncbi:MAG: outer membrane protein assembly factor BamA [Longimicrobiaceae bacterium]